MGLEQFDLASKKTRKTLTRELNSTEIGKKAGLLAKLQPGRARKRINATKPPPFSRALYMEKMLVTRLIIS